MQNKNVDDLDLRDIILTIWNQKARLVFCSLLFTLLATAYAFLSTPIYEASSNILPPTPANLSSYNVVAQSDEELPTLDTEQAYKIFVRHLSSGALKLAFFEKYYLPEKAPNANSSISEREELWRNFNSVLDLALPTINSPDLAIVRLEDKNPNTVSTWVNEYIEMAMQSSSEQALNTLTNAIKARIQQLNIEITGLRAVAEQDRLNRIVRLKENILLAQAIGLKSPANNTNLIIAYTDDIAYLRGSLVLEAELALLEARKNNDPFIEQLPLLEEQLTQLSTLEVSTSPLKLASIDNYALSPEVPIKPKKTLIILLGFLLGLIVSVFVILVREWWTRSANRAISNSKA